MEEKKKMKEGKKKEQGEEGMEWADATQLLMWSSEK